MEYSTSTWVPPELPKLRRYFSRRWYRHPTSNKLANRFHFQHSEDENHKRKYKAEMHRRHCRRNLHVCQVYNRPAKSMISKIRGEVGYPPGANIPCYRGRHIRGLFSAQIPMADTPSCGDGYGFQRRKRSAPLVPPKPKEFDIAYSISALRAWLGTRSIPAVSGSGFSRLIVGGIT